MDHVDLPTTLDRHELFEPGDVARSYALVPYESPLRVDGRPRPSQLLWALLEAAGVDGAFTSLLEKSVSEFGDSGTVWGLKLDQRDTVRWELYYYDHFCAGRPLCLERVRRVVGEFAELDGGGLDPETKVFSLSVDIDVDSDSRVEVGQMHAYAPQPSEPATCLSYGAVDGQLQLENVYYLLQGTRIAEQASDLIRNSLICRDPSEVIWEDLLPCDHIAWTHKPNREGLYFGGLGIEQFRIFLDRSGFPSDVVEVVRGFGSDLDHLLFDVGMDFCQGESPPVLAKRAFYGVL